MDHYKGGKDYLKSNYQQQKKTLFVPVFQGLRAGIGDGDLEIRFFFIACTIDFLHFICD